MLSDDSLLSRMGGQSSGVRPISPICGARSHCVFSQIPHSRRRVAEVARRQSGGEE